MNKFNLKCVATNTFMQVLNITFSPKDEDEFDEEYQYSFEHSIEDSELYKSILKDILNYCIDNDIRASIELYDYVDNQKTRLRRQVGIH